jgi:hypothetical protein
VYGSWLNAATGVVFASTANSLINFLATSTGKIVITNSVAMGPMAVVFNGFGGGWTLGSGINCTGIISFLAGTFDTGNFAVVCGYISATGPQIRVILLGSSTITCSATTAPNIANSTNLTFNAGTSTITCTAASLTFIGGGQTFYNVNFTNTTGGNTTTITGNNTFNNLNQTSPVSNRRILSLGNSQVVTGTLTLGTANAYNARVQVINTNVGSPITLTVGTIATLADVDFRDITAAGASGTWAGTRLGNGLGNANITFVAGKTVYWNLVAGGNWSANAWATSSGGAVATANFPLAQDTAIIDNAGLTASNTITYDASWWLGTLNSIRTAAWTFLSGGSPTMYGDFTLTTLTTTSGTANLTFTGKGATQTLTTNGVSLTSPIFQQSVGGTLLLNGSVTSVNATSGLTLSNGTVDLNGYTLTCSKLSSTSTNLRAIAFGVGKIILTGSGDLILNFDVATNFSYTGSGDIEATYSGSVGERYFVVGNAGGGSNAVAMNLKVTAGTDLINVYRYWRNVDFTGFAGTWRNAGDKILSGNLTMSSGMTLQAAAGQSMTFDRTGTQTITSAGKTIDYPVTFSNSGTTNCLDALTLGSTRALTFTGGTLNLKSGVTSTVNSFVTTGTTLKYLGSTTLGTQATISDASGTNTVTYLTVQDSAATGGAVWNAVSTTNVDAGNNIGWGFPVAVTGVFAVGSIGDVTIDITNNMGGGGIGKKPYIYEEAIDVPTKIVICVNAEIAVRGITSIVRIGLVQVSATRSVTAEARSVRATTRISIVEACQMKNVCVKVGAVSGTTRASRAYVKSIQNLSDEALMLLLLAI